MLHLTLAALAFFLLDRWTKAIAQRLGRRTWLGWLQCTCVLNHKPFYASHAVRRALIMVFLFSLGSAWLLHASGSWFQTPIALLALGCAFGGAAANLLDILQHQSVVDFIDLGWWPIFNLADVGIVGGLVLAFWRH